MFWLHYCTFLSIFTWTIINGQSPSIFDVRIDDHKVDITHDLVINTPRPHFSWKIRTSNNISQRNIKQTAYQIQLHSIQLTQKHQQFTWDSQHVRSSQSIHVPFTGQEDLLPSTYYAVRIRIWTTNSDEGSEWSEWIRFRTPIFNLHQYLTQNSSAVWIGSTKINMNELRKEFNVSNTSPVKSAIVYITGIGYYELYLNGNKVDASRKLDPGWTTYEIRVLVATFDLTPNITNGVNAVGVKLGNGWYSRQQTGRKNYGPPRLLFTLLITFENGEEMEVVSDQTWTGREGAIKHDSVYNGEFYDSRYERSNWAEPGFNDTFTPWIMPEILSSPFSNSTNGTLSLQDMPPIRAGPDALHFEVDINYQQQGYLTEKDMGEIKGAKLTDGGIVIPIDEWLSDATIRTFDLGQNIAGWCRLRFEDGHGYGIHIRYAEILVAPSIPVNESTRNVYVDNLRQAAASDTYILHGDARGEFYESTFTYHGFRYIAVLNPPQRMSIGDVECLVVHTETTVVGHFSSSNPIINQIQHNIQWGQLSNIMSLPTDCPQRNERLGWMGDAALTVDEALYNFDLIKFYRNFLTLITDVQHSNGELPNYVPGDRYPADSNWGTALPTITWQVYRHYNDVQTLADYYDHNVLYVKYLINDYNKTGLANYTFEHGDWVPPEPYSMTNRHLTTSYGFLYDVNLLINMSKILNKTADTEYYSALYEKLTEEFHRVFYNNSTNCYADGLQAAQVLALALPNVVPNNVRQTVVDYLVSDIRQKEIHVTTGIIGTSLIYPVLSGNGHHDLALELISSTTYPSYGFMFNNSYENATTLWELWNAPYTGPKMNSRNHIMFGSVGAWFYSHLAGIDLSSDVITIRPRMASEQKKHLMSKLDCQLSTLYGLVHVSYTRDEHDTVANSILLRVSIPPNARGRVMFEPLFTGAQCNMLMEGGQVIWSLDIGSGLVQDYIIKKDPTTGIMSVDVGSGDYTFQALWQ